MVLCVFSEHIVEFWMLTYMRCTNSPYFNATNIWLSLSFLRLLTLTNSMITRSRISLENVCVCVCVCVCVYVCECVHMSVCGGGGGDWTDALMLSLWSASHVPTHCRCVNFTFSQRHQVRQDGLNSLLPTQKCFQLGHSSWLHLLDK